MAVSKAIRNILKGDIVIWVVVIFLFIFSILSVYSSTFSLAYKYKSGNTEYYVLKHLFIIVVGFALMYYFHRINYKKFRILSWLFIVIAVPLLLFTFFKGTSINEASRWITVPVIDITFQTSDLAKIALIMYVARLIATKQGEVSKFGIEEFKNVLLPVLIPIFIVCLLILKSNFSTSALLFFTCFMLMYVGRVNIKYLLLIVAVAVLGLFLFIIILSSSNSQGRLGTWKNRVESFTGIDLSTFKFKNKVNESSESIIKTNNVKYNINDENYQVAQAKIAIATGGIIGKMPGNSMQKNFIPHSYSDFIYSIIIEEYGLIGGVFVLLLYLILMYRVIRIVIKAGEDYFGALLAFGLGFSIVFQALINMCVAVYLLPVTGQPLPFVSMGGTAIWFSSISLGIILSISREYENKTEIKTENKTESKKE